MGAPEMPGVTMLVTASPRNVLGSWPPCRTDVGVEEADHGRLRLWQVDGEGLVPGDRSASRHLGGTHGAEGRWRPVRGAGPEMAVAEPLAG